MKILVQTFSVNLRVLCVSVLKKLRKGTFFLFQKQ